MDDDDCGREPLDNAFALSDSEVCEGSRGDKGAGARLLSTLDFETAEETEEGTTMSAGGEARFGRSVIAVGEVCI